MTEHFNRGSLASGRAWGGIHGGCLRASEAMLCGINYYSEIVQEYLFKEHKDGIFSRIEETA